METALFAILVTITIGWVGWVSVMTIQNSIKISSLMTLPNQMTELKTMVSGVNTRLDIFLKTELDTLKSMVDKNQNHGI